jgi:hypothetical protein
MSTIDKLIEYYKGEESLYRYYAGMSEQMELKLVAKEQREKAAMYKWTLEYLSQLKGLLK